MDENQIIHSLQTALDNVLGIYLFGSRVQGTPHPESDLDIAVLVAGYAPPETRFQLANELADSIGIEVDLLDLRAASTVMAVQVLQSGKRIWAKNPEADTFEAAVMSDKMALDRARAPLLAEIQQRGSIYGR